MSAHYYNRYAKDFFNNTVDVDMSSLYQVFELFLPERACVVDAGCGSGRDSRYFLSKGYNVTSFDASHAMVSLAHSHTQHSINQSTFLDFQLAPASQDAVWACASLLHVPYDELSKTFAHLATWLKPSGIIYCSFKYGEHEVDDGERRFTNLTEYTLKQVISTLELRINKLWITDDLRADRANNHWLNAILIK